MHIIFACRRKSDCLKYVVILIGYDWINTTEKMNGIHEVVGSIPISSTKKI